MASLHFLLFLLTFLRFNTVNADRQWIVDRSHCPGFSRTDITSYWNEALCVFLKGRIPGQGPKQGPLYFPGDPNNVGYNSWCCKAFLDKGVTSGTCAYIQTTDVESLNGFNCLDNGRTVSSTTHLS